MDTSNYNKVNLFVYIRNEICYMHMYKNCSVYPTQS